MDRYGAGSSKSSSHRSHDHKRRKHSKKKSKHKKRSRSSSDSGDSSDSSSSSKSVKLLQKIQKERELRVEKQRQMKEVLKATETPEEKRLRRLKKKEEKERKRKERMGWDNDYLHYTNTDNPFGDSSLLSTFVWKKKLDKDGLAGITSDELEKRNRDKQDENRRELEKVKKRRIERELERQKREEETALLQRNKEAAQFQEYEKNEDHFHLEQARLRSKIRIQDGRAKPIDLLAKYISAEEEVDAVEMHEPYTYLHGLSIKDLEDVIEDIKVYKELEKGTNLEYWNDLTVIVEDELHKLRKLQRESEYDVALGRREGIHKSVAADVASVFKGKTAGQLEQLQKQIESKISGKTDGVDVAYWESLLSQLKAHMARARLRDRHQDNLRRKLELLKAQQGVEVTVKKESSDSSEEESSEKEESEVVQPSTSATDMLQDSFTEYSTGEYSPVYLQMFDLEPGTLVCQEQEDEQRLSYARATMLGTGRRVEV